MTLKDRFLRYIAYDTQSSEESSTYPSTPKQLLLQEALFEEMHSIGLEEVSLDASGYLMGSIPATKGCEIAPVIGFIAHIDTSPDMSGAGIRPRIIDSYAGGDIQLNPSVVMKVAEFPELKELVGHTIIHTDGTTLLGADDKAGVAEIMTAAQYLMQHPEIEHGKIRIAFTPDEEVGRGVDKFDVRKFGADFAYTVDGGAEGELEYENFNAASAKISIRGRNVHPGSAKGKMINAIEVAYELNSMLHPTERPEYTDGYEGFFHCTSMVGSVEHAEVSYLIRDHSNEAFEKRKVWMWSIVDLLQQRYGKQVLMLALQDQYSNMKRMIEPHPQLIEKAKEAMLLAGVEPIIKPIRGGTDGARLSFMGLPCPNLFTGGANFHGRYEYASFTTMQRAVDVIVNLAQLWSKIN